MAERIGRPYFPEQRPNGPPLRGRVDLSVTTGPKPSETRTSTRDLPPLSKKAKKELGDLFKGLPEADTKAPPPTKAEAYNANTLQPSWETGLTEKLGGNKALKIGGATAAGLGVGALVAWQTYENIPAVHVRVGSFLNSFTDKRLVSSTGAETKKVNPEEIFHNKARSGEVGTIKRIPEEEVGKLDSFAKIDDHNTVQVLYPIDVSTSDKPDAKIEYTKGYGGSGSEQDIAKRRGQGYLNLFYFEKVPARSTILAPVDGLLYLTISRRNHSATANDHPINNAVIEFQSRKGDTFVMQIGGGSTKGGSMMNPPRSDVFRSLTNAPIYNPNTSPSRVEALEQAIPVKKGQPIMQSAIEIDLGFHVSFAMRPNTDMSKFKKIGEEIVNGKKIGDIIQEPATNLELFLSEEGEIVQPQLPTR